MLKCFLKDDHMELPRNSEIIRVGKLISSAYVCFYLCRFDPTKKVRE